MRISLVTLGDPDTLTGGYLYHRRMANLAATHSASLSFVSFPDAPFPLPVVVGLAVCRRLRTQHPDVVVLDSIAAAFAAPWLSCFPRPLAAMVHQGPGGIDHGPLRSTVQRSWDLVSYRRCTRVLVASQTLVASLTACGLAGGQIAVVPPGRDLPLAKKSELDLRSGRRVALLCVGNWIERKGIVELLEAVGNLPGPLCTLHLVGDQNVQPAYAARVKRLIDGARLRGRVHCHGVLSSQRIAQLYAAADVFVLPSMREPYGTVYGEAMAAGLPVVGWRAGNLPHLARDGVDGLIVEPKDVRGLTTALRSLCEDDDLRATMSASARARAESFPTWEESARLFYSELRSVAASTTM